MRFRTAVGLGAALLVQASCSTLPGDGPRDGAIVEAAATTNVHADDKANGFDYALIDVTREIIGHISTDTSSLSKSFGAGRGGGGDVRAGIGDVLAITIFESTSGGLFIPSDAGSRPGNYVQFPNQTVDQSGTVAVPYAGQVPVVGRTLAQIKAEIEKRLASRALEPQALITLVSQHSNDVSVVGDVNAPGRFTVSAGGERVLDLLAHSGGLKKEPYITSVTLQRGGRYATIPFERLVANPAENIYVSPQDTLYVYAEAKSYVAFGATGNNLKIDFGSEKLSLAEAIGMAGGLLDGRADPAQVFVYRMESSKALRGMKIDVERFGTRSEVPAIYRVDLRDPAGYFAARNFMMRDKDILFVSNAQSVELIKFLSVLNSISATTAATPANAVTTRDAIHQLGRGAHAN